MGSPTVDLDGELTDDGEAWLGATSYEWPTGPYIPHQPSLPQEAFLWLGQMEALYGGAAGGGKLLKLDTPIPTPTGWTTMGELHKGDELFDEHGNVIQVVIAHAVDPSPVSYRVHIDDGSYIDACADHRWLTHDAAELAALTRRDPDWRAARRAKRPSRLVSERPGQSYGYGYCQCGCGSETNMVASSNARLGLVRGEPRQYLRGHAPASALLKAIVTERNRTQSRSLESPTGMIRTTQEIFDTLKTPSGRTNHAISVAGVLDCEEADLPLDPYLLGVWLGGGTKGSGMITSADPSILLAFEDHGYSVRVPKSRYGWYVRRWITDIKKSGLNLYRNKHVPPIYLRGSREQRLALLQGLMDTDGTCNKSGSVSFTNMNRGLTEAVAELARSLGSKCAIQTRLAKLNGESCGAAWLVKWTPDYPVFRLKRKLDRQNFTTRRTTKFHYIVACEQIKPVPMRCITVSSQSGLFLAGESMIPTHNSDALLMAALQYVDIPGYSAILFRRTFSELQLEGALLDRSTKWLAHTDASWNGETMRWTFPSGARLQFGYLAGTKDRARYQSAEFQFIGMDELTAWEEPDYKFLFSRLRGPGICIYHNGEVDDHGIEQPRAEGKWEPRRINGVEQYELVCEYCGFISPPLARVPLRMRAATNPGGVGARWVKARFIKPYTDFVKHKQEQGWAPDLKRPFVPAKLSDNPHVDQQAYRAALGELDPELMEQLLEGNWNTREPGNWMLRDPRYIDACEELGRILWDDHISGFRRLPAPVDGLINCMDWGEHSQAYVVWRLPDGGIFVPPSEVVCVGEDPAVTTRKIMEQAMKYDHPLVQSNYDAAGIQSMRTYVNIMRKLSRYARLRSMKIAFGEYKKETIGYLRTLSRRTHEHGRALQSLQIAWDDDWREYQERTTRKTAEERDALLARKPVWRILAIHPGNVELIRQLRAWQRKDEESDDAVKTDDHGPDALVAGVAPTARANRQFIEDAIREAYGEDDDAYLDEEAPEYERVY